MLKQTNHFMTSKAGIGTLGSSRDFADQVNSISDLNKNKMSLNQSAENPIDSEQHKISAFRDFSPIIENPLSNSGSPDLNDRV